MMEYQIVEMAQRHVSAVAEIEKLCFSMPWSENSISGELQNPLSLWLVAEAEGTVLAYIGSQSVAGESDIMNVAVHPQYRGKKIAVSLVAELLNRLLHHGNTAVLLEVRKSNFPAISLYEKMGFQTVGVRPNYYFSPKEDALIMRKELIES